MKYTIIFFSLIILLVIYILFGHNGILKFVELSRLKINYEQKSEEIDRNISILEEKLNLIEMSNDYIEYLIRNEIGMQKPDEDTYIFDNLTDQNQLDKQTK